ncbi:MAG: VOC family protein [Gammaproteobacteria bacterium]|nr:VOC family protein [Gammaproteobacteria bacterium]NNC96920.1 VOC family protein [Gammaproteobacteria bacterium]NNM13335.1 VOC family protein [Gammaproteobacteria bacterium]
MTDQNNFLGLRTVVYSVTDLHAAKQWYSDLLGYAPYFDEEFYVGFNVGGYELGLSPNETRSAPGGSIAYWGVKDAKAELARVLDMGATMHADIQDVGDGILVVAVLDPWGNVFGIIENAHFKAE